VKQENIASQKVFNRLKYSKVLDADGHWLYTKNIVR